MPRDTETRTLGTIVDELEETVESAAAQAAQADDPDEAASIRSWGSDLDQRLAAFEDLVAEHGDQATVTIADLTPQERADHGSFVEAAIEQWEARHDIEGSHRKRRTIWWAAAGVVDAPWFGTDAGDIPTRAATLRGPDAPPWPAIEYLAALVTEANSLGNEKRKRFDERVAAHRTDPPAPK